MEEARETVRRYERARRSSLMTAAAYDVPVKYVWQPSRHTRQFEATEPHGDSVRENRSRLMAQIVRESLPDDVIDLSDALSDLDGPLFTDDVHHNERAARAIAEDLFEAVADELRRQRTSRSRR